MQTNTATKFLPVIREDKKMEVSLEGSEAVLKLSTWTENLGWNCQKTMRLDVAMLDDLHGAIAAARYKLNHQKAGTEENAESNIIKFPAAA